MEHSIELDVYQLVDPNVEFFDEATLQITFDVYDGSYTILDYSIYDSPVELRELLNFNPNLKKRIEYEISHYITNLNEEPDYFDCE